MPRIGLPLYSNICSLLLERSTGSRLHILWNRSFNHWDSDSVVCFVRQQAIGCKSLDKEVLRQELESDAEKRTAYVGNVTSWEEYVNGNDGGRLTRTQAKAFIMTMLSHGQMCGPSLGHNICQDF